MHLVDISDLKSKLTRDELSQRQGFEYFFAIFSIATIMSEVFNFFPSPNPSFWDVAYSVVFVSLSLLGTLLAFQANGADQGREFFVRYFSLTWVLGIRFSLSALVLSTVLTAVAYLIKDGQQARAWYEVAAWGIWLAVFYLHLSRHISEVAGRTA